MKTPEIHLMDMMAGWAEFVYEEPKEHSGDSEKLFDFYQESANLFGIEEGEIPLDIQEPIIRRFFEEKIFPYIFGKEQCTEKN